MLASVLGRNLIRLQCYEGIDTNQALYEWDYARQMLHIRALPRGRSPTRTRSTSSSARFLLERPLLEAVRSRRRAVLLIDEVDRADDEFEAFLLEVLSDFQVTIPEIGTVRAERPPLVVLTSNRTRELHDALKRRCLYHWIDYPSADREVEILLPRGPAFRPSSPAWRSRGPHPRARPREGARRRRDHRLGRTRVPWRHALEQTRRLRSAPWSRTATTSMVRENLEEILPVTDGRRHQVLVRVRTRVARCRSPGRHRAGCCPSAGLCRLDPTDLRDLYWSGRTALVAPRRPSPSTTTPSAATSWTPPRALLTRKPG